MKIEIEGKEYEIEGKKYTIDAEKALSLGVLKEDKPITSFNVGDLYILYPFSTPIVIIEHGYCSIDSDEPLYNLIGFCNSLRHYSNFKKGATKEQMIEFLSKQITLGAKFIKNINENFDALVNKAVIEAHEIKQ